MQEIENYDLSGFLKEKIKRTLLSFLFFLFCFTTIYYSHFYLGLESWKVPLILSIISYLILFLFIWFSDKWRRNFNNLDWVCLGYFTFLVVRSVVSKDTIQPEPIHYIKWLFFIFIYFICKNIPSSYFNNLIIALSIAGIASWLLFLFNNSGHAAAYFSICFSGLLSIILYKRVFLKSIRYYILAVLLFIGLIITFSRGALLAIFIVFIYLLYTNLKNTSYIKGKKVLILLLTLIFFIALSLIFYKIRPESANVRFLLWRVCGENFLHKPFFGYSICSIESLYMYWQAFYFQQHPDSFFVPFATNHYQSFNEILRILCEQGIMGFSIMVYIIVYVLVKRNRKEYLPIKVALIALMIVSCFLYTSDILPISMLLPLFIGLLNNKVDFSAQNNNILILKKNLKTKILVKSLFSLLCLVVVFYSAQTYLQYDKTQKSLMEYMQENESSALTYKDENIVLKNKEMALAYASYSFQEENINKRIEIIKCSSKRIPTSTTFLTLGLLYLQIEDFQQCEKCYLLAHHMVPDRMLPKYYLFNYYKQTNDSTRAKDWAEIILNSNPRIYNAVTVEIKHSAKKYLHY